MFSADWVGLVKKMVRKTAVFTLFLIPVVTVIIVLTNGQDGSIEPVTGIVAAENTSDMNVKSDIEKAENDNPNLKILVECDSREFYENTVWAIRTLRKIENEVSGQWGDKKFRFQVRDLAYLGVSVVEFKTASVLAKQLGFPIGTSLEARGYFWRKYPSDIFVRVGLEKEAQLMVITHELMHVYNYRNGLDGKEDEIFAHEVGLIVVNAAFGTKYRSSINTGSYVYTE